MRSRADDAPAFLWTPSLPEPGGRVDLDASASHRAARVWRAQVGEVLILTDGAGARAQARVLEIGRRVVVEVEALERLPAPPAVVLLCGAPEGERGDWLVEKAAELGVSRLQPVDCARGRWEHPKRRLERWRRLAVAAMCQSRGRFLLDLGAPLGLPDALVQLPPGGSRMLADAGGAAASPMEGLRQVFFGLVGPAAGLTPAETASAEGHGFARISLGHNRLRAETAAVALASLVAAGVFGASEIPLAQRLDAPGERP